MTDFSLFEYCYRDAANYKSWGTLLLSGSVSEADVAAMSKGFLDGEFFIAEQLGVPPMYADLWKFSGGSVADDHVWHTFHELKPATPDEVIGEVWGTVDTLAARVKAVKSWDATLSPHWYI
ncbi:MAG: hypothetical protein WCL27_14450 [Betaproteobacteria bacterium]